MLFVYGTLKSNCCRNSILSGAKFIADTVTFPSYRLYNVGSFPALVYDDNGIAIIGELWEVDESLLKYLDIIEGVSSNMYARDNIKLSDGTVVTGYTWQRSTYGMEECGNCWTE